MIVRANCPDACPVYRADTEERFNFNWTVLTVSQQKRVEVFSGIEPVVSSTGAGAFCYSWGNYPLFEALAFSMADTFPNVCWIGETHKQSEERREKWSVIETGDATLPEKVSWPALMTTGITYGPKLLASSSEHFKADENTMPSRLMRSRGEDVAPADCEAVVFRVGFRRLFFVVASCEGYIDKLVHKCSSIMPDEDWVTFNTSYREIIEFKTRGVR